jgi:hypothetical protein
MMDAHVPVATPVRAMVHAWHVPLHGPSQQMLPMQLPSAHCPLAVQAWPFGASWHVPVGQ